MFHPIYRLLSSLSNSLLEEHLNSVGNICDNASTQQRHFTYCIYFMTFQNWEQRVELLSFSQKKKKNNCNATSLEHPLNLGTRTITKV